MKTVGGYRDMSSIILFMKSSIILDAIECNCIDCLSGLSEQSFLCFKFKWWGINTLGSKFDHVEKISWESSLG